MGLPFTEVGSSGRAAVRSGQGRREKKVNLIW